MTFTEQVWGTTNERIHTLGTASLLLSLILFLCFTPLIKPEALAVFYLFSSGCTCIGLATIRNSWSRWRTGEDTLILLRRRGTEHKEYEVTLHLFGRALHWKGRIAHVDVGEFSLTPIDESTPTPTTSAGRRSHKMFRAGYWAVCSSIPFQALFGIAALGYGIWLFTVVFQYMGSYA
jgi:hypothetical protein